VYAERFCSRVMGVGVRGGEGCAASSSSDEVELELEFEALLFRAGRFSTASPPMSLLEIAFFDGLVRPDAFAGLVRPLARPPPLPCNFTSSPPISTGVLLNPPFVSALRTYERNLLRSGELNGSL
jgi:hypothetical protein